MLCGEASIVNISSREIVAATLKCRSWGHPPCAELRKYQLMQLAIAGRPNRFLTLTSHRRTGLTAAKAANNLRDAWAIIYREIVRRYGKANVSCLAIFEQTKRGWPHLHVLCRMPFVPQAWLSNRMGALTGAPIVDIRTIGDLRARAAYVSKYVAKDPHIFKGCKRYWRSLDWIVEPDDDDTAAGQDGEGWKADRRTLYEIECWCLGSAWGFWYERNNLHAAPLYPEYLRPHIESLHGPP